jgi:hypothetical protein
VLEAAGNGTKMAATFRQAFAPAFPSSVIFSERVLAVKGSLRRAQQRRPLDRSGPF